MAIPSIAMIPSGYKASKLYSVLPTDGGGDLDVVRATTATRVNSEGLVELVSNNIPRLDYTNGGCPSLLVEPQRTNLLLRSEEFDNAYWTKSGITISANSINSPNNLLTSDSLVESAINENHSVNSNAVSVTSGLTYRFSVFAKNNGRFLRLILPSGTFGTTVSANFDLSLGIAYNTAGSGATIENYGNGWYRCSVTITSSITGSGILIISMAQNSSGNGIYTGDGTSGIYIWGAQLEQGSNATSYIPTVASTVTRNADVISKTGISDLINSNIKGAMFFHFSNNIPLITAFGAGVFTTNTGTGIFFRTDSGNIRVDVLNAFSTLFTYTSLININNSKLAVKWDNGVIKIFINGILRTTSGSISIPSTNSFALSSNIGFTPGLSLTYNSSKIYNTEISDAQLIDLTTL